MKRGLIIGNSHVAMIAKSWRHSEGNKTKTMALDFFAQAGEGPTGIEITKTHIRATDPKYKEFLIKSGAAYEVELTNYDFFVVVACGLSIYPVIKVLNNHRIWGWPNTTKSNNQLISIGCFETALYDIYTKTLNVKLANRLREHSNNPIYIVPQPLPSIDLSTAQNKGHGFRKVDKNETGQNAFNAFEKAINSVFSNFENTHIISQPLDTIAHHIYTDATFTKNSVRLHDLDQKHSAKDTLHANHHYGALVLDALITKVSALSIVT